MKHCQDCGGSGYISDGLGSGEPCGCNGMFEIETGDLIKVGPWCGVVVDVLKSTRQTVLEVDFVKNAQRMRKPELVPVGGIVPIVPATPEDLLNEFEQLIEMQLEFFAKILDRYDEAN